MRSKTLFRYFALLLLVTFLPAAVVAPIKGVSTHTIQAVGVSAPGEGLALATDVDAEHKDRLIEQAIFEHELEQAQDKEAVIEEWVPEFAPPGERSPDRYPSSQSRAVLAGMQDVTVSQMMEIAMRHADQETVASALEGTALEDHPLVIAYTKDGGDETITTTAVSAIFITHIQSASPDDPRTIYYEWRAVGDDEWKTTRGTTMTEPGTIRITVTGLAPDTDYEVRGVAQASDGSTQSTPIQPFSTDSLGDNDGE